MKKHLRIRTYNLTCEGKQTSGMLKIVFLTDMHNRLQGAEGEAVLEKIAVCDPDLVLVGGDVLVGKPGAETETAAKFIKKLSEKYPVWYANGNHEQRISRNTEVYGDMGDVYDRAIEETKAVRLINQRADFEIKGIPVTIYGHAPNLAFYEKGFRKKGMEEELERAFGIPEKARYTILLAHNPRYGKEYLEWGADLTLSGHYHGGVMLLGKRMGLVTPDFRLFSRFCCGIRSRGDSHMVVSAGVGEHTIPVRIHNPREITLVQVRFLS